MVSLDTNLRNVFDPSHYKFISDKYLTGNEKESRQELEKALYEEIATNLEKDVQDLGIPVTYATKILIGEIAMNLVMVSRVKFIMVQDSLLRTRGKIKPTSVNKEGRSSKRKTIDYEEVCPFEEDVHPVFSDFLPKLEKRINISLKLLGLLPQQQAERQKFMLIKKLKKKLFEVEDNEGSSELTAVFESKENL